MSQYIQFFIRATDKFLPILTTSRSSTIYRFFGDYAPYEKVRAITKQDLQNILDEVNTQINEFTHQLEEDRNCLQLIASFNNSVEEKFEAIEAARETIRDAEEAIEETRGALYFTRFLMDIYDEAENSKYYEGVMIEPTKYIYFGIECGTPSIEELEE